MGAEVHVGGVEPHEERLARGHRVADEALGLHQKFVVAGLLALLGERPGVLDPLAAIGIGPAVEHAAGAVVLFEIGEIVRVGIIPQLRFFLGIEVIKVAEELIEALVGGQVLIPIAEMVLAELAGAVAEGLEQAGDGGIFGAVAELGPGQPHLGEPGAEHALTGDEGSTAGGAALLGVIVDELATLLGDPVDVRGLIPHQPIAVTTEVALADVVAPEDEDVGFAVGHGLWMAHLCMLAKAAGSGHSESAAMPQWIPRRSCLRIRRIPPAHALLSMGRCSGRRSAPRGLRLR